VILLLSTYDLGRQPFGLASPAAWLREAGHEVAAVDLSRQTLDPALVARAAVVAVYLPMHTATRLAVPIIDRVRAANPEAVVCAYGLYAPLNADLLRAHGVSHVLGPEFEADLLLAVASGQAAPRSLDGSSANLPPTVEGRPTSTIPRLALIQPDRRGLPGPDRYAALQMPDGTRRVTGSTDATRGCKHRCRHCPIVPVYDGQFRVVPVEVVLADIRGQVEHGARHITFADPDFLNAPTHARRIADAFRREWPAVTYDVTIKVEHLLRHRALLPVLADTGCLFVTSAVESVDDRVLERLEKGHTRADFFEAAAVCRAAGLTLSPTFVAFTPWTTLDGYADLLEVVSSLDLVGHVAPVQWGIRLLVTSQSRLLELPDIRSVIADFDGHTLTHPWRHADPRVDALQARLMAMVGVRVNRPRHETFDAIRAAVDDARGGTAIRLAGAEDHAPARATIPYLNEPWYC
jgi:radical SAM superfamily enzyme YgiQ (UPF0313 family)